MLVGAVLFPVRPGSARSPILITSPAKLLWPSGYGAALLRWRSRVQSPPGALCMFPFSNLCSRPQLLWPSGYGAALLRRRSRVQSPPGARPRQGHTCVHSTHFSHTPINPNAPVAKWIRRRPSKAEIAGSTPARSQTFCLACVLRCFYPIFFVLFLYVAYFPCVVMGSSPVAVASMFRGTGGELSVPLCEARAVVKAVLCFARVSVIVCHSQSVKA